jgi:hypothetical protein
MHGPAPWSLTGVAPLVEPSWLAAPFSAGVRGMPLEEPGGGDESHQREEPPPKAVASAQRPDGWV